MRTIFAYRVFVSSWAIRTIVAEISTTLISYVDGLCVLHISDGIELALSPGVGGNTGGWYLGYAGDITHVPPPVFFAPGIKSPP